MSNQIQSIETSSIVSSIDTLNYLFFLALILFSFFLVLFSVHILNGFNNNRNLRLLLEKMDFNNSVIEKIIDRLR